MNTSDFSLTGKVAVVTGAASGIGKATVERFSEAGATVVLVDVADATPLAAATGGHFIRADVTCASDMKSVADMAAGVGGGAIHILVNNAGVAEIGGPILQAADPSYQRAWDVNFMGAVRGIREVGSRMSRGGSIVNVASMAGRQGFPTYGSYSASKAALINLTMTAAVEMGEAGIRVNCICPSTVDTPMNDTPDAAAELAVIRVITPLARICRPGEAAALIHFLAADDCSFITGQAINLCGGVSAGFSPAMIVALAGADAAEPGH